MNSPRRYRFATAAQWRSVLASRFEPGELGLRPIPSLGAQAVPIAHGIIDLVAADPAGEVIYRRLDPPSPRLWRLGAHGRPGGPWGLDDTLAASPRWVVARGAIWGYDAALAVVNRYDAATLDREISISAPPDRRIVDVATDGRGGLWVLLVDSADSGSVWRLDRHGRSLHETAIPTPIGSRSALGSVQGGRRLVVVGADGTLLDLVDPDPSGTRIRTVRSWPNGAVLMRLATDGRDRIAAWCALAAADPSPLVFDADGGLLDGPWSVPPWSARDAAGASEVPAMAVHADTVWLAGSSGLWRLDASLASSPRPSESGFVTPALASPAEAGGGWLRAEIVMELPAGAVLDVDWRSTSDARVRDSVEAIAGDDTRSADDRIAQMWDALGNGLDPGHQEAVRAQTLRFTGPSDVGTAIAVPVADVVDTWIWLRLTLHFPPAIAPTPVRELRVLHPEEGLASSLPAIFRAPAGDPTGMLRRLVGVIETTTQGVDERIASIGPSVNPVSAPVGWLDFLARWFDLPWDDGLAVEAKRELLLHAGEMTAWRGTRRGLELLLRCLLRGEGRFDIRDMTVDHPVSRFGGRRGTGLSLPALLAGASPRAAVLGAKAVLGLACLGASDDPLASLTPRVRVRITASPRTRRALADVLARVVEQVIPAGTRVAIVWKRSVLPIAPAGDARILDARGRGFLGVDSEIGRTVVDGRRVPRLGERGSGCGPILS